MKNRSMAPCAMAVALAAGSAVHADVIHDWSNTYIDIIRQTGGAPCPISRDGPMMYLAMYDAVNGIDRVSDYNSSYEPYQSGLPAATAGSSREAAAAMAAFTVMSALHASSPANLALISATCTAQLAAIPDGPAKSNGMSYGESVANLLLAQRQNDGYDADPSYTPGGNAGDWRVTPDGPFVQPFTPHWGNVTPWGLESGSQFRPTTLTDFGSMSGLLQSQAYADQINGAPGIPGVKDLGSRNSAFRTPDQTEAAWFWANDRDGTSKPPGHLIQMTQVVSSDANLSLSENARLFGLVGLALGDACIAAWDAKYNTDIDLWRPIDAIRETIDDGNPNTSPVADWLPLNDFTPPFPAYVSGHATFGGVHASILASFFGTDDVTFTLGSDEFAVNTEIGYDPNLTRTFNSFSEAGWENAMSRVWLGVHFYWDALDGFVLGNQVGEYIYGNHLRPVPAPGSVLLAGLGGLIVLRRRRSI